MWVKKDLAKLCAHYRAYGADSLLLACLAYNVGSGRVNKSNLVKKLKSGCRDIHHDYTSFCRYQGRKIESLFRRRWLELDYSLGRKKHLNLILQFFNNLYL